MKMLEGLLAILHYILHGLGDVCWTGKEILREIRELRETEGE